MALRSALSQSAVVVVNLPAQSKTLRESGGVAVRRLA
jgi:hypothetical protein